MAEVQDISEVRKKYKKKSIVKRIILIVLIFILVLVALSFTNETVRDQGQRFLFYNIGGIWWR